LIGCEGKVEDMVLESEKRERKRRVRVCMGDVPVVCYSNR
jgi:hypothetical protein